MGVNDRRLLACPAVIPHHVENTSFAAVSLTSDPVLPVQSRAKNLLGATKGGSSH
jgi:hypothetical protein